MYRTVIQGKSDFYVELSLMEVSLAVKVGAKSSSNDADSKKSGSGSVDRV